MMRHNPNQVEFSFLPEAIPQGDGSYLIRPGRPIQRLTTAQAGAQIGVSDSSVRRYIAEGLIPADAIECAGKQRFLINAAAIAALKQKFKSEHGL